VLRLTTLPARQTTSVGKTRILGNSYAPGLEPVLRGVSVAVEAGSCVGLCGRTGAGKSSMLGVLLRVIPCEEGQVRCGRG
jgi:ABC-type multidrug transport system fused ATPase/permease subunit